MNQLNDYACRECGCDGPHTVIARTCEAVDTGNVTGAGEPVLRCTGPVTTVFECGACYAEFEVTA